MRGEHTSRVARLELRVKSLEDSRPQRHICLHTLRATLTEQQAVRTLVFQSAAHFLAELESQELSVDSEGNSLRLQPFEKLPFHQHLLSLLQTLLSLQSPVRTSLPSPLVARACRRV